MAEPRPLLRSRAELLDDAERYERWAERMQDNPAIRQRFLALAAAARATANR